jgi:D-alanyl-lipoteichoic acid acyltransferase DltB (MBOAT superfamily)
MLFNSTTFFQFFAAFLLLYWLVRRHLAARNGLVVTASLLFYGWWDWRFLGLLLFTSLLDFGIGLALANTTNELRRRRWLWLSVVSNLGVLGLFKYCGFFLESFHQLLGRFGVESPSWTWNIILPVGISFYTFQSLSYTIDVYRRQIPATRNPVTFLAFVSFFPQLVAGPIERAAHLLPQFEQSRVVTRTHLEEGVWLILWGLFKKVVIADNLAPLVELAFDRGIASGPLVALGTIAFAGQIYGDFSGYSDIARGTARLLGFELMENFRLPYLATSVREFWRRWHISLSTWLRDYLYVPLGGSRGGEVRTSINLFVTMLLGGLWHGAAWNFVLWGAWHGTALVVQRSWNRARRSEATLSPLAQRSEARGEGWGEGQHSTANSGEPSPGLRPPSPFSPLRSAKGEETVKVSFGSVLGWCITLLVVLYGWLLFRAGAWDKLVALHHALIVPTVPGWFATYAWNLAGFLAPLVLMQLWQWRRNDMLVPLRLGLLPRALLQGTLVAAIWIYWQPVAPPFIYFQF